MAFFKINFNFSFSIEIKIKIKMKTSIKKMFQLIFRFYALHHTVVTLWYIFIFYMIFIKFNIIGQIWGWTNFKN